MIKGKLNAMMNSHGRKLYRLPQEGMIKGVCAGLARYRPRSGAGGRL